MGVYAINPVNPLDKISNQVNGITVVPSVEAESISHITITEMNYILNSRNLVLTKRRLPSKLRGRSCQFEATCMGSLMLQLEIVKVAFKAVHLPSWESSISLIIYIYFTRTLIETP